MVRGHVDEMAAPGQMLAISAAIAVGALTLLLASYYRLRNRDLSVNPIAERVAKAGNDDNDTDAGAPGSSTPAEDIGERRTTPA